MLGAKSFGEKFAKRLEEVAIALQEQSAKPELQHYFVVATTLNVLAAVVREVTQ